mmetsp:Transcript_9931/g.32403  ORF Transcript_9931/g.32403 Transcript_9931/m.32403 type:complete len:240 (+) Transcript_9931:159-878(+)
MLAAHTAPPTPADQSCSTTTVADPMATDRHGASSGDSGVAAPEDTTTRADERSAISRFFDTTGVSSSSPAKGAILRSSFGRKSSGGGGAFRKQERGTMRHARFSLFFRRTKFHPKQEDVRCSGTERTRGGRKERGAFDFVRSDGCETTLAAPDLITHSLTCTHSERSFFFLRGLPTSPVGSPVGRGCGRWLRRRWRRVRAGCRRCRWRMSWRRRFRGCSGRSRRRRRGGAARRGGRRRW